MLRVRYLAILFFLGALLAVPAFAVAARAPAASPVTITLGTENNSGESGTGVLTDLGSGQTKVDVTITGEPANGSQPMHIHSGQCGPTLGPVVYPLTNVVGGASTTTITATLDSLMDGNHAINVHLSQDQIGTFVACGNIPSSSAAAQVTGTQAATAAATAVATTGSGTAPTAVATAVATTGAVSAATPAPTATVPAPTTAPITGGNGPDFLVPVLALGLVILAAGLLARRLAVK